jgi:hypothetical protein
MLKKILDMFFKNKTNNLTKDYQGQPKTTINETGNVSHNEIGPANPVSGAFGVIVTGVSFYQKALEKICGGRSGEGIEVIAQAKIIPYGDNPYDAYAVRIEIEDEIVGHLSRKDARKWRSKMISEGFSGAVTCPAKIVWDRGAEKAGSYGVWLDTDLTLSDSKPERNSALTVLVPANQSNHIEFPVNELNRFELSNCRVGDVVNLWVADEAKGIFIYRQGTDFGEGKIGVCPDAFFDVISAAPGCEASIASIYEGGCRIACKLISKEEMAEREKEFRAAEKKRLQELRRDLTSPVEYSSIDSDIYRCFISNKTGMSEEIGTWEQFAKVEEHIANLCQEKKRQVLQVTGQDRKICHYLCPHRENLFKCDEFEGKGL